MRGPIQVRLDILAAMKFKHTEVTNFTFKHKKA